MSARSEMRLAHVPPTFLFFLVIHKPPSKAMQILLRADLYPTIPRVEDYEVH